MAVIHHLISIKGHLAKLAMPSTLERKIRELSQIRELSAQAYKLTSKKETALHLSRIHNKFDSLIGGLSTADYSDKDVSVLRGKALRRILGMIKEEASNPSDRKVKLAVESSIEKTDEQILADLTKNYQPKVYQHRDSDEILDSIFKDAPEVIKKFAHRGKDLSQLLVKRFIFSRVPVIPITPANRVSDGITKLKRAGFPVEMIGKYPVLDDQLVLGLNVVHIMELKDSIRRNAMQLAEFMVTQLSQRSGKKYVIVGSAVKHKTGLYYWVVPDKVMDSIVKTLGEPKQWGFAF